MFRKMRRIKQELTKEEVNRILERNTNGVLALLGDEDYPYAVPVSYLYANGKLFFHGAKQGHKVEAIKKYEKASFCVVDQDEIVSEEFTTYFRSVIAFGKIKIMEDEKEIRQAIELLADKYSPNASETARSAGIDKEWKILCMLEMDIEHITGKESIELIRKKSN